MSLDLEALTNPPADDDRPAGGTRSILDEIRREYEQAEDTDALLLWVPKSRLGIRYRPLDPLEIPDVEEGQESLRTIDVLVVACSEIVMRDRDGKPITLEQDGMPVRFTAELAEQMGWTGLKTARDIALRVFSTAPSPKAAAYRHFIEYNNWLGGGQESLLGES